jgi:sulfite exporter TauE/SafE
MALVRRGLDTMALWWPRLALSASYQADERRRAPRMAGRRSDATRSSSSEGDRRVCFMVLGAVGASVAMPPQVTAVDMIVVAIADDLRTRLTAFASDGGMVATPWAGSRLGVRDGASDAYSDTRAAGLGALSFFLPCGFTQAVQIYALSTGSPLFAGVLLATFAIGTAPGLLALAGLPVVVPSTARPTLLRLVGVVVIGFAFVNASAGVRLSGVTLPEIGIASVAAAVPPPGPVVDGKQTLHTYQDLDGYRPGNVAIYAGIPTTWTIESTNAASCASLIRIPRLGMGGLLHTGLNTVELPPLKAGTLSYTCSMGMYSGQITIVDPPTGMSGATDGG